MINCNLKYLLYLLSVVVAGSLLVLYAPSFLSYKNEPAKSDVVILFSGNEQKIRELEAEKLLREGYACYLIVPLSGEVLQITPDGRMVNISPDNKAGNLLFKLRKTALYKKYYEDTHIEALEAKRMMDESGFRSAIMVSSPYHMRRIRLIADKVFGDGKNLIYCIPTSFERT